MPFVRVKWEVVCVWCVCVTHKDKERLRQRKSERVRQREKISEKRRDKE